ncbi:response regulator [Phosphitispora fastidiosa]|uniref:response regulator n=1 Tax=Phosphitispora fastidiosa TaxID=2837202 RepID=UPI001E2DF468|nr:response regulator transcription factor [Phosphitispora fastidiosa]MBU7006552.1 DNA-binding NarL/FixJ family response regulator [Phosphitispora fastidiosa]
MRVIFIDDHPLVRKGLAAVLTTDEGFEVVGQADNGETAVRLAVEKKPEVIIMDLRLGNENGLDVITKIKLEGVNCKFVVLTSSNNLEDFRKAGEMSVDGYISKDAAPEEFLAALRAVGEGRKFFDPEIVGAFMSYGLKDPLGELTPREREVLNHLGKGMNNREIAEKIFVTEHTVKKHVSQILDKLDLADRTQAALFAANYFIE